MEPVVRTRIEDGVGHLLLDRPKAMNSITVELGSQLEAGLRGLAEDATVIVIRGAGGNFSVGGDFRELQRLRAAGQDALVPLFANFQRACGLIAELDVPVIAAVEGYAMAGGFELTQASDIALVRNDATLADNHANFDQVPGGGGSQRLPRLLGRQRALGHLLSGDRMTGAEAVACGLAYRGFEPAEFEEGVAEFARKLAATSKQALGTIKRLVYQGLRMPLEDGLALELRTVVEHVGTDAAGAGMATFTKKEGA